MLLLTRHLQACIFGACLMLSGCGGSGGGDAAELQIDPVIPIAARGFAASGIFAGTVGLDEVLLVLDSGEFFLLAGDLAGQGSYGVNQITLSGNGTAYRPSAEVQNLGGLTLSGEYRTDRHLDLTWTVTSTGESSTVIVEATPLYFDDSPIERVLGTWINQDSNNLIFFNISDNRKPIAGDDLATGMPGETLLIPVLSNDRDPDGDPFRISQVDEQSTLGGALAIDDSGTPEDFSDDTISYVLPESFEAGSDSFGYSIEDVNEDSSDARVAITLPARQVDLDLTLSASNLSPAAGALVDLMVTVVNDSNADVRTQVLLPLPSGLVYREDSSAGDYDSDSGFWSFDLLAGDRAVLSISAGIAASGEFDVMARISSIDATELNPLDDADILTLAPSGLDANPETPPASAQIEGILLSSLSQISGTITANPAGVNVYSIQVALGSGGLGGDSGAAESFQGVVILSEEEVVPEEGDGEPVLRDTMLILTVSPTGPFLNKLFAVSEDELQEQ